MTARYTFDPACAQWRTSSEQASTCVEVAGNQPGIVAVRDSKDPDGPILLFGPAVWASFTSSVKGS